MCDDEVLSTFVRESNLIENEHGGPGQPIYENHLAAAKYVLSEGRAGRTVEPREIHRRLAVPNTPPEYRVCNVRVGPYIMPPYQDVLRLMWDWTQEWEQEIGDILASVPNGPSPDWIAKRAWEFHDWFLCIHPFRDGNGRTARLLLNSFRICCGPDWFTVYEKDRCEYYNKIRAFETGAFEHLRT